MSANDYPFLHSEQCPDCGVKIVAVVELKRSRHPSFTDIEQAPKLPALTWLEECYCDTNV
jgi:hypothetical protein